MLRVLDPETLGQVLRELHDVEAGLEPAVRDADVDHGRDEVGAPGQHVVEVLLPLLRQGDRRLLVGQGVAAEGRVENDVALVDDEGGGGLVEARLGHESVEALPAERCEHLLHQLELSVERLGG